MKAGIERAGGRKIYVGGRREEEVGRKIQPILMMYGKEEILVLNKLIKTFSFKCLK